MGEEFLKYSILVKDEKESVLGTHNAMLLLLAFIIFLFDERVEKKKKKKKAHTSLSISVSKQIFDC